MQNDSAHSSLGFLPEILIQSTVQMSGRLQCLAGQNLILQNSAFISSPETKAHKVSLKDGHALEATVRHRPQFQRASPLKPHSQTKPNFMWSILRKGERKFM